MSPDTKSKIDTIVSGWQNRFKALQQKQEAGEIVGANDVRDVVLATGEDIDKAGLTPEIITAGGYRVKELEKIFDTVSKHRGAGVGQENPIVGKDTNVVEQVAAAPATPAVAEPERAAVAAPAAVQTAPIPQPPATPQPQPSPDDIANKAVAAAQELLNSVNASSATALVPDELFKEPAPGAANTADKPAEAPRMSGIGATAVGADPELVNMVRMPVLVIQPSGDPVHRI